MRLQQLAVVLAMLMGAQPATGPAQSDYVLTPMRVTEMKGADAYLYGEAETTFATIKDNIDKLLPAMDQAITDGKFKPQGEYVFVYEGISDDMAKPFKMRVGKPAAADAKAFGDFKVRRLPSLRAATVIYTGPVTKMPEAFPSIYQSLFAAGHTPTGEVRESYVYWEGPESLNNVIIIQVGVK